MANVALPMSILMPVTILLMIYTAVIYPSKKSIGFYLTVLSTLLFIVTLIITVTIEVPIDSQIKTWTTATMPSDWEIIRSRWNYFHTLRTFTSFAAFGCFLSPALFDEQKQQKTILHSDD
jgi:uncharacterized membrane protein